MCPVVSLVYCTTQSWKIDREHWLCTAGLLQLSIYCILLLLNKWVLNGHLQSAILILTGNQSQSINASLGSHTQVHQSLMTEPNTRVTPAPLSGKSSSPWDKNCLLSAPLHVPGFLWPWRENKIFPSPGKDSFGCSCMWKRIADLGSDSMMSIL